MLLWIFSAQLRISGETSIVFILPMQIYVRQGWQDWFCRESYKF